MAVMDTHVLLILAVFLLEAFTGVATTNATDFSAISGLKEAWKNAPPDWGGSDPCGASWTGIGCNNTRITKISLAGMGLTGMLPGDIGSFSELQSLDLSYNKGLIGSLPPQIGNLKKLTQLTLVGCGFSGLIPDSIGSMQELVSLSLNSNGFSGLIPPAIGNLSKLYWLDLSDNQLSGNIPVSQGSTPGLDMLLQTKHFHFGKNQLNGTIPPQLFSSKMTLIHLLFDNNQLTGNIPSTLGLVQPLEVILLSNNRLSGPLPNLNGMKSLNYLDLSNNSFGASDFPSWIPTLQSLMTLMMDSTQIQGPVPALLFSLSSLQTVVLRNNQLNGTLDIGTRPSNPLQLIDLENNSIDDFKQSSSSYTPKVMLQGNPVCQETGAEEKGYCNITQSTSSSYSTKPDNCSAVVCMANATSSPKCKCAYPFTGTLLFMAPRFSYLGNSTYLESLRSSMLSSFQSHQLPVDSFSLSNPQEDSSGYLELKLEIFPSGNEGARFNQTGKSSVCFVLGFRTFDATLYGPYSFIADQYEYCSEVPTALKKSVSIGIIAGAAAGGFALLSLVVLLGIYALNQNKRAERVAEHRNPFVSWESNKRSGSVPQLKGAKWFSLEELRKYTKNFSEANKIGSGGYGKVYRGCLPTGEIVAIKRAQQGSMQGGFEFKTEIELLSRVHHKNLVSLVGFCFEQGEQLLVYEFIPNGTLKESLSGQSGIRLDWARRLRVALDAAHGLAYLHELANPRIIHRDIKSTNILLDERLNARVSDFGLSKPMGDSEKDHISTQIKGTMGYLDPEYYMTQQLTEKSDVYSFGVVMLELITAKRPIERGKYIVREVKMVLDKGKDLYNLHGILDPTIGLGTSLKGLEKFVELAMKCVEESGEDRPTMGEVVKEIEDIMVSAGLNPRAERTSTSASYEEAGKVTFRQPYNDESFFDYSGAFPPAGVEPK